MHFGLPNIINPTYIQQPVKACILSSIQNNMGICKHIIILIFHNVTSMLVTLIKFIYVFCTSP